MTRSEALTKINDLRSQMDDAQKELDGIFASDGLWDAQRMEDLREKICACREEVSELADTYDLLMSREEALTKARSLYEQFMDLDEDLDRLAEEDEDEYEEEICELRGEIEDIGEQIGELIDNYDLDPDEVYSVH